MLTWSLASEQGQQQVFGGNGKSLSLLFFVLNLRWITLTWELPGSLTVLNKLELYPNQLPWIGFTGDQYVCVCIYIQIYAVWNLRKKKNTNTQGHTFILMIHQYHIWNRLQLNKSKTYILLPLFDKQILNSEQHS